MYLNELLQRMSDELRREQTMMRYAARLVLPLLIVPLIALTTRAMRGGWEALVCALGVITLVAMVAIITQPSQRRTRTMLADAATYLPHLRGAGRLPHSVPRDLIHVWPGVLAMLLSIILFGRTILAPLALWQQLAGVLFGLLFGLLCCLHLAQVRHMLYRLHERVLLESQRRQHSQAEVERGRPVDGLLDPVVLARLDALPVPAVPLSPAALALVRTEAYVLLRDTPDVLNEDVRTAMRAWTEQAQTDELHHWMLPTVGGKIYLPCTAGGTLSHALGATARRLGMDGAYSGTLGTWLVRLPPARSYAVQARLIDALVALGMLPIGSPLIHHLTLAGDLGAESGLPALLHLMSTPLVFEKRPGHAEGDDRPFLMRGGGVLDDLGRGRRSMGQRTDFVDGFLLPETEDLQGVEHLTAHLINLRIKQLLGWAILATRRAPERRSAGEQEAARRYAQLRIDMRALLERYELADALSINWIDGSWREQWRYVQAFSRLKLDTSSFLPAAQSLRDAALNDFERLAVRASGQR